MSPQKESIRKVVRDARTGRFVKKEEEQKRPRTTVNDTPDHLGMRNEIASLQDRVFRVAIYTFIAAVVIIGIAVREENYDKHMLGVSMGVLLLCSLVYQLSGAMKIFWTASYVRRYSSAESEWEKAIKEARKNHRLLIWPWLETRAIAYCYMIICGIFIGLFKASVAAIVLNSIGVLLALILVFVPEFDYDKWVWDKARKDENN